MVKEVKAVEQGVLGTGWMDGETGKGGRARCLRDRMDGW